MSFLSRLFPQVRQMERDTLRIKSEREEWRQRYVSLEARAGVKSSPQPMTYKGDGISTIHQAGVLEEPRFRRACEVGVEAAGKDLCSDWRVRIALWAAEQACHLEGDFVECGSSAGFLTRAVREYLGNVAETKTFHVLEVPAETSGGLSRKGHHAPSAFPNLRTVRGSLAMVLEQAETYQLAFATIALKSETEEIEAGEFFWPRMVSGGVLLLNQYGYAGNEGHRRAWESFSARHGAPLLPLPTGQGLLVKAPGRG